MKRLMITGLACLLALTGCAQFDSLADDTHPRTGSTPLLDSDAPAPMKSPLDAPVVMKAKGVINKGDTTGTYNGETYSCGNADCSLAIRGPLATPAAQSNGARK